MTILETERLIIRQLTTHDAPFILELLNQPSFLRFIGDRGVRNVAAAEKYIQEGPLQSYERFGFGLWLVSRKADSDSIGICGLIKRDHLEWVDIGYAFLPEYWSKGYAREAAAEVLRYGQHTLKLGPIAAIVDPENSRSIQLLEKIGLRFERTIQWPPTQTEISLYITPPRNE